MDRIYKIIWLVLISAILLSCSRNPLKIDISGIQEEVRIIRFEQELIKWGTHPGWEELTALRDEHPDFTDLFTDLIIRIGMLDNEEAVNGIHAFLTDTMIQSVYRLTEEQFEDFRKIEDDLVKAFKHYLYYYPERPLPDIYTCISGFNESAFVAEGFIGISLDKYLGSQTAYYTMLGIPRYKQRKMVPEMITADVVYVWAMGEFNPGNKTVTVLDHIIHEGKLLYFMEAMMPEAPDSIITGFTAAQVEWCRNNEPQMWTFLIEKELLYSTKQMDIVRYINDGPQTSGFPQESPGRTGAWIGWQIIRKYMKRNPEVTLNQLMENTNYQEILNSSAYLP
ncbi:MAG: DUF2268 domain-containing putative Zn-dependent protease [Bacteroidota bacterium]